MHLQGDETARLFPAALPIVNQQKEAWSFVFNIRDSILKWTVVP